MAPHTIQDIVGDGAVHAIAPAGTRARWVQIYAVGGQIRVGDAANVGAGRGAAVASGGSFPFPESPDLASTYDLSLIAVYVPISSTATICYGV